MKNLIIFGSGDHAKVIFYEVIKLKKYKVIGFIDDDSKKGKTIINFDKKKYLNLGSLKDINVKNISGIIGVGSNFIRKNIFEKVRKSQIKIKWEKIISKNAIINENVDISEGTIVLSGSLINSGTKIGCHCIINNSTSINHDNFLDDFSSVGPGVVTGGNVKLGECSHLGIGTTVLHKISIESNTIIGAHSLVNKNCKKNFLYFGVPAIKIKSRKKNSEYL